MDSDFADKLKEAIDSSPLSKVEPSRVAFNVPRKGCDCPANFNGSIQEAFRKYCADYAGKDFEDPRGICVTLSEENFPKLVKLRYRPHQTGPDRRARAKQVLEPLRDGTFDESRHFSEQPVRLRTLFWIKETICHPDGIHPNCAAKIEGEEVYFKRFDRSGSDVKLVFTAIGYGGQRIVITSFMDDVESLDKYCGHPALWPVLTFS